VLAAAIPLLLRAALERATRFVWLPELLSRLPRLLPLLLLLLLLLVLPSFLLLFLGLVEEGLLCPFLSVFFFCRTAAAILLLLLLLLLPRSSPSK